MSKIRRLVDSYSRYISVPWRSDAAAAQRVGRGFPAVLMLQRFEAVVGRDFRVIKYLWICGGEEDPALD